MKTSLRVGLSLLCLLAVVGCSTPHSGARWEYKTVIVNTGSGSGEVDQHLNRLAHEGWSVVSFSRTHNENYSWAFVLKRRK